MGYHGFTYADNGTNIYGGRGYLYLTNAFARAAKLPNPLPFTQMNDYGQIRAKFSRDTRILYDVYALYGAQLILREETQANEVTAYIQAIKDRELDEDRLESLEEGLRLYGIRYFDQHRIELDRYVQTELQKLGNQPAKTAVCFSSFTGMPLLISRKKLPKDSDWDLWDIARYWGCVSDTDPVNGYQKIRNHWMHYQPVDLPIPEGPVVG